MKKIVRSIEVVVEKWASARRQVSLANGLDEERRSSLGSPRARVRRDDDPGDPFAGQAACRLDRLQMTELGQAGVDDPGVATCRGEVQVELALAVPQQDHRRAIQAEIVAGNPTG